MYHSITLYHYKYLKLSNKLYFKYTLVCQDVGEQLGWKNEPYLQEMVLQPYKTLLPVGKRES